MSAIRGIRVPESVWWDEEFDVVIAGGGGAGLIAAVEAAEVDAQVLLVEKQADVGAGATGMSIGSISAAGTDLQRAAGIEGDTIDAHYQDLLLFAGGRESDFDLNLSRLMVEHAPGVVARLTELGVEFSGPHPEPPHRVYRMHNAVPSSQAYVDVLRKAAEQRGVTIRTEMVFDELERDGGHGVSRILLRHDRRGETRAVRVRKAVVLAAGDFSANDELARRYGRPPEVSAVQALQPNATGDGITIAMGIGAGTAGLDRGGGPAFRTVLPPYSAPDRRLFVEGAILVNRLGQRFANELDQPAAAAADQPAQQAFLIFDGRLAERIATSDQDRPPSRDGWYREDRPFLSTFPGVAYAYLDDYRNADYLFEAESIAGLAKRTGLPPAEFEAEIERFSASATAGRDERWGRQSMGSGIVRPPFFAIGPLKPIINFSAGGLRVDREMRVLDEEGGVIPRLYSCGANAEARVFLGGHGHHLAWAFGSGRIAGRNAAQEPLIGD
ncbi:MAG TPA: FAD-dependent oxidoreductase [Acidobacteriota bacterium]|nr:FAD-dependent oxidoreductase [Acidobacteriota bacterium]